MFWSWNDKHLGVGGTMHQKNLAYAVILLQTFVQDIINLDTIYSQTNIDSIMR